MSDRTDSFLKFIEDVITKKIVYHLFDDEVEFLRCVILSYLLALEITCSCFHDFIDKDLIDLVLPYVMDLYRLVKERYSASRPEGYDLMLWGDLYTLFEPDGEDEIWKNQHEYNLIS
ncbi:hypothetical protein Tco_0809130 [Tanacetum coccineum]